MRSVCVRGRACERETPGAGGNATPAARPPLVGKKAPHAGGREGRPATTTGGARIGGPWSVMPLIVAPTIHPSLIATPLAFAVGYVLALRKYLMDLSPVTAQVRSTFGTLNARLNEAMEGIETVKGAAREDDEITLFEKNARAFRDAFVERGRIEARFLPLLLLGLAQGMAFIHSLYLYRADLINVGDLVSYMGLIALFGFPTFVSLFSYSQVSTGYSSAGRILELIRQETELDQNEAGHASPIKGAICFDGVTFDYGVGDTPPTVPKSAQNGHPLRGGQVALTDISFGIEPGQTLALVGQTGSGKSTVAKLINRIYDVTHGAIFVDGVDVRDWDLAALRRGISIIEQDIFLFSRTIGENIAFGKPESSQEEIEAAARAAQAHEFILSFPEGYDTVIGERGVMLSGGQRQRLALARAFLTDPAILILDDSTSAIDSATEDKIQKAIEAASQGRTTILITHRLSQIRWADKIVVLRKGRVAAVGSHDELLATSPAYQEIFARYLRKSLEIEKEAGCAKTLRIPPLCDPLSLSLNSILYTLTSAGLGGVGCAVRVWQWSGFLWL